MLQQCVLPLQNRQLLLFGFQLFFQGSLVAHHRCHRLLLPAQLLQLDLQEPLFGLVGPELQLGLGQLPAQLGLDLLKLAHLFALAEITFGTDHTSLVKLFLQFGDLFVAPTDLLVELLVEAGGVLDDLLVVVVGGLFGHFALQAEEFGATLGFLPGRRLDQFLLLRQLALQPGDELPLKPEFVGEDAHLLVLEVQLLLAHHGFHADHALSSLSLVLKQFKV